MTKTPATSKQTDLISALIYERPIIKCEGMKTRLDLHLAGEVNVTTREASTMIDRLLRMESPLNV